MTIRYLLDTNAVSDMLNRRRGVDARAEAARRRGATLGTCTPVVGELYDGACHSSDPIGNLARLERGLLKLRLWLYDRAAAIEFGRLRSGLRRRGRPMQDIDIQLAAVALALGNCVVVTTDSDLSAVPGLSVENWAA